MILALTLYALLQVPPTQDARISVFVTAPMREGFVDTSKPMEDSIKDIRGSLKGMKELRLLDTAEGADLVLVVIARGVGSQDYGVRTNVNDTLYQGVDITTQPMTLTTLWVSTVMQAGTYRREIVGHDTARGSQIAMWRVAGENVAKNVKAWAIANTPQLRAKRTS